MQEINAESYIIPPALITLVQNGTLLSGLDNEDPYAYVGAFVFLSSTCKLVRVPHDEMKSMFFPFSLRGQALVW